MGPLKRIFIPLVLFSLIAIFGGWVFERQEIEVETIALPHSKTVGEPAHDFLLQNPNERRLSLKDFEGNPVLIHFWASWCAPCLKEIPDLVSLAERLINTPMKVILISLDERWEDSFEILSPQGLPANVAYLLDPSQATSERYGSYQFPETYLLDRHHRIVMKWIGAQPWDSDQAMDVLKRYF